MTLSDVIQDWLSKKAELSPGQKSMLDGHGKIDLHPTESQKDAGNYRKLHLQLDGYDITIENPKGSVRSGTSPDGKAWKIVMQNDYGELLGQVGKDGDRLDIFLSDTPEQGNVYVVDQVDPKTEKFDEHKVMYGFPDIESARAAYLSNYKKDWKGLGAITGVTKEDFKKWVDLSDRKTKPFKDYALVKDPSRTKVAQDMSQKVEDDPYEGLPKDLKLRSLTDPSATRQAIFDNIADAVTKRFPVEDDNYRLELKDVKYEGPQSYGLTQQKQALLNNRRLSSALAGTWRLIDKKTGNVLEERRDSVLRVPYYTDRGTIINNGNEYTVVSQSRLSPGVYIRRKQNGELEAQFNVNNGRGFRIGLDKETGVLNLATNNGHIPLYPVMKALGVSDEDLSKSWGTDVAAANMATHDPRAIAKLYARFAGYKANPLASETEQAAAIKDALETSGLDPDVVVRTLGITDAKGVTPNVILRAAQKLLNVNRGVEDPDDRDNPRFSKFYGIEDTMRERIDKDAGRLAKSILFRVKRDKSLARVSRNALSPYLDSFLSGSGLAQPGEEANPLSILTQQGRITKMGEGGISSADLVTPEARNIQGDYLGYVDPIAGPESEAIGVDLRSSLGTMKGSDHRLYNKMVDLHTGKTRYVALDDAASHTVAFPGQDPKAAKLYAMKKGVPTLVDRSEVDFMVPSFSNVMSSGINMNPMPTAVQAGRQFYAAKFWEQFLPQKKGELPLVDSLMDDGKTTFSEYYGRKVGCLTAPFAGTVVSADDKQVVIKGKDGKTEKIELVQNLPFNRLSAISYFPAVKKGDEIAAGGILANSNFTDPKTGAMNMGQNLKVAIMTAPRGTSSYEDAIVISEKAAKRLATSRMYGYDQDTKNGVQIARNKYLAAFPKAYTKDQAETIDDNGVVKVGTVLHRDDPILLALGPKLLSAEDAQVGKLSSVLRNALTDKSQKWEHDWPGVVTDVVAGPHGAKVLIKSEPPVKVGDKLAPRDALKGVVANVIPDEQMPRDATTNEPYDMLVNPMGFLSRVAPGQVMEIALAKVAKKTGHQIRIPQIPPPEGWYEWTQKQMKDNGVNETSDVFDPQTGRTIKGVGDGYMYVQAFHHLAEKKFSARGIDGAYTQDEQPAKGGPDGAKRVSGFDDLALLSHGATEVLKDSMTTRGQMNGEYWRRLRLGLPIQEPGTPFIYQKFLNTLRAGGVNVVEKGDITSIMPQTDKDIEAMAGGRVVESSQMVDSDFKPVQGGLFDLEKTGGMGGNRWSMISLPEPVPNPVMEEPVRRILGLTVKGLSDVLSGRQQLNGKTGGAAIKEALGKVNIDQALDKARDDIRSKRGAARDNAVKVLGYLKSAKEMQISPADWMISMVPVLPPAFRPVSRMGDVALVPDMNDLYKELLETKHNYEDLHKELPDSAVADERLGVYKAVKAAYGFGDSVTTEGQAKNLKGAIRQVIGTVPKFGMFQSKVVSKSQDLVGRGAITPDRNLDMDQIGIPEEMAWEMYKPFITRGLVKRGYSPVDAIKMIENKDPTAKHIMTDVMDEKPVLMDRAPTWHKFNIMSFRPFLVEGKSVRVCPLICSGFNADFDGDFQIGRVAFVINGLRVTRDGKYAMSNGLRLTKEQQKSLHMASCFGKLSSMKAKIRIPFGTDKNSAIMVSDLADFPHGEFSNHVDGKNGPIDFYHAIPGTSVVSMSKDGKLELAPVAFWSKHENRALDIVTLADKRQIFTDEDPRAVFGINPGSGNLEFARADPFEATAKGFVVPCVKDTGKVFEALSPVEITEINGYELSSEFGWLLGALCGDGWWDKNDFEHHNNERTICLSDLVGENAARATTILRKVFNSDVHHAEFRFNKNEYKGRYGDSVRHSWYFKGSTEFSKKLSEWLGGGRDESTTGSGNKHLPPFAFTANRDFRIGLVCGLFDTDGSVCVNKSMAAVRMMANYTTTSLRLAREVVELMRTLGVGANINAYKTNSGNNAYGVFPSVVGLKSGNILSGLATSNKREAFLNTEVDLSLKKYDTVVMPDHVANIIFGGLTVVKHPSTDIERDGRSAYQELYKAVKKVAGSHVITRGSLSFIMKTVKSEWASRKAGLDYAAALLREIIITDGILTDKDRVTISSSITANSGKDPDSMKWAASAKAFLLRWSRAKIHASETKGGAEKYFKGFESLSIPACVSDNKEIKRYLEFVGDENITWQPIAAIEATEVGEDGYDLTVPGPDTFMNSSGVILSNTVNIHVPASEKASKEALAKMLPSKNLFSLTDMRSVRYRPEKEQISGLWALTRGMEKKETKHFATKADAMKAYRQGLIGPNDPVEIGEL